MKEADTTFASDNQELTIKRFISKTVTFKVVNGSWDDGEGEAATADRTVTLTGYDGDTLKLSANQIPAVGSRPNETFKAGSWDVTPGTETTITGNTTYTYTYAPEKAGISHTVTFKVVNGFWDEGEGEAATADKTVTLTGLEGDTLKLTADQIPGVGNRPKDDTYKEGSWDVTPSTETEITQNTTYTYTYAPKDGSAVTDPLPDKVPLTAEGEFYASAEDNFAAESGSGKINGLVLDFSRVGESSVAPSDLKMTAVSGSRFTTRTALKDKKAFRADKGIKVKVNKNTLIPSITVKKSGNVTLEMSDGNTYTIAFRAEKPKAVKGEKKQKQGSGKLTKTASDLFGTSIDSGEFTATGNAEVSGKTVIIDTAEKGSAKIQYRYLNKIYKMTVKIK